MSGARHLGAVATFAAAGFSAVIAVATVARAQAGDAGAPDAAALTPRAVEAAASPSAERVEVETARIRALLGGNLEVSVEPRELFGVDLDDEQALRVEAARLRTLLSHVGAAAGLGARHRDGGATEDETKAGSAVGPGTAARDPARGAALTADAGTTAGPDAAVTEPPALDGALWDARLELDRARLEFYELSRERRQELLRAHAANREAARPEESAEERQAREAEEEQRRVLAAARAARSEAERLLNQELGRLLGVERNLALARERIRAGRDELPERRTMLLGWQHRAQDAKRSGPAEADATYDALRRQLRRSRDDLSTALDALGSAAESLPEIGADPLEAIPLEVPIDAAREQRRAVEVQRRAAVEEQQALLEARAATLLDEIDALNRERLRLLPFLSAEKRGAITGFTAVGLDQARSEARHLGLIVRYHHQVASAWLESVRSGGPTGLPLWRWAALLVPWGVLLLVFTSWRRRSGSLLARAEQRLAELDRDEQRLEPSPARRALQLLIAVHRPLEWLVFLSASAWLLPEAARRLLEFQLLSVVVGWLIGGALVVNTINALVAGGRGARARERREVDELRLRSLRLVGRVAVVFILILVLSARLVGEGTIYSWVLSTCWLAAVPIFLLLVRWWRTTVFERIEQSRKKSALRSWVLAHRTGYESLLAAMLGAGQLCVLGSAKLVRSRLGGLHLARRMHAYLFRRELERLADHDAQRIVRPLRADAARALDPERPHDEWLPCPADPVLTRIRERTAAGQGGVVLVVGRRGLGKTSLFRQLAREFPGSVTTSCVGDGAAEAILAACERRSTSAESPSEGGANRAVTPPLVLLDDAHALVRPVLGGIRVFDEVLAIARARSTNTLWVFAMDSVLWPFLRRARDSRPLFDQVFELKPWTEEQLAMLLGARTQAAGPEPTFEDLLEPLPPLADEVDRQEALAAKRAGYLRMIWDYALGTPAIALEVWRSSLREGDDGSIRVRTLQVPDPRALEQLPDSALFVLRAVLQLPRATSAEVAELTHLSPMQVENTFRFGQAQGYFVEHGEHVGVPWRWLRSVLLILERRHVLVKP